MKSSEDLIKLGMQSTIDSLMAESSKLKAEIERLREALNNLLNDCINFDGGKLTDHVLANASQALKEQAK